MQWRLMGVAAALVIVPILHGATSAQDSGKRPATRVAVVDMMRILKESRGARDMQKDMNEWLQGARKGLDEASAKMKKIDDDLQLLDARSADYQQMKDQLETEKLRAQQLRRRLERESDDRIVAGVTKNYDETLKQVRAYATAHGFDMVLQIESGPMQARSEEELIQHILLKNVVYADESLDITSEVLKILGDK